MSDNELPTVSKEQDGVCGLCGGQGLSSDPKRKQCVRCLSTWHFGIAKVEVSGASPHDVLKVIIPMVLLTVIALAIFSYFGISITQ